MINEKDFSPNQLKAIKHTGTNLLISAGAGSGKTRTLITKLKELISEQKIDINSFLVVTFTDSASLEMKSRLKSYLTSEMKSCHSKVDYLKEQLEKISTANISTLHSFCQKLIKKYAYTLDIDNFLLITDRESSYIKSRAIDNVFNNYILKEDIEFLSIIDAYSVNRKDIEFKKQILSIYEFLINKYDYENWIETKINESFNNIDNNIIIQILHSDIQSMINYYLSKIDNLKILSMQSDFEQILPIINDYNNIIESISSNNFILSIDALKKLPAFPRIDIKSKNLTESQTEIKIRFQKLASSIREDISGLIEKFTAIDFETLSKQMFASEKTIKKLLEITKQFIKEYSDIKFDKKVLDFNDLEKYTLQALENPLILNEVCSNFEYVFVDEYQDINDIQEKIITLVSRDNNLTMVGDVKQSIYNFRHSNPNIFLNKLIEYASTNCGLVVGLNQNFRSKPAILEFCNFVFDVIMTSDVTKIDYRNTARFEYIEKNETSEQFKTIDMYIFDTEKESEDSITDFYDITCSPQTNQSAKINMDKEINLLAQKILEFKNSEIFDESIQANREVKFSDICVLSRKRENSIDYISRKLTEYLIPVNAHFNQKLYKTYEVSLILNFMHLIVNRFLDIELASVLLSRIVGLCEEDIVKIRQKNINEEYFYSAVLLYAKTENDEISEKINKLFKELDEFYINSQYLLVPELARKIIQKYDLINHFLTKPDGATRIQNIEQFLNSIVSEKINSNLYSFIDYVENFSNDDTFETSILSNSDAVTIDTIHSSKGLEFPIVILFDAGSQFSSSKTRNNILLSNDLGITTKYFDLDNRYVFDTLSMKAFRIEQNKSDKAEYIRLLYVALSRAKDKLVIIGSDNVSKLSFIRQSYEILKCNNYIKMLIGALDEQKIEQLITNKKATQHLNNNIKINIEILNESKFILENNSTELCNKIDNDFYKLMTKEFNFNYNFNASKFIQQKNSVTKISEENLKENSEQNYYNIQNFKITDSDNYEDTDFVFIGNSYHKVMQYIDFNLKENEIEDFLLKLLEQNTISPDEKNVIETSKICTAIKNINKLFNNTYNIKREQKFLMCVPYNSIIKQSEVTDRILIQGIIDLLIENEDEILVVDYKTTKTNNIQYLDKIYRNQLECYAKAVSENTHKKVKKIIYSFYHNDYIEI